MCGYRWTTAHKCENCPECCYEMAKIEGEQPNCHFTIYKKNAGDAAPFYKKVTKKNPTK
jgi:hypothetical protein